MKLLFCSSCQDIFKLQLGIIKSCNCGSTGGQYLDPLYAEYTGDKAIPLGIDNHKFVKSINTWKERPDDPRNDFSAFIIRSSAETFKKVDKLQVRK